MRAERGFESTLERAGLLVAVGLIVQLVTSFWIDALAFVLFLVVGGALTGAGVLLFLRWLALPQRTPDESR